jgi:hypothetical protein
MPHAGSVFSSNARGQERMKKLSSTQAFHRRKISNGLGAEMKPASRQSCFEWQAVVIAIGCAVALVGCSRSDEMETMKQQVDAHQLQAWAKELLKEYPDETDCMLDFHGRAKSESHVYVIPTNYVILTNYPTFLDNMPASVGVGPAIRVSGPGQETERCVHLLWIYSRSQSGHAIDVGNERFTQTTNAQCVEWIPGVYYQYLYSP